jgi:3-oxoacyl-(acyl-carrier-protein) synthase
VFIGITVGDYLQRIRGNLGVEQIDAYSATGDVSGFAVGRLSYVLGLQDPNFPIDTTCSSSLVAVHLACQSLRQGESALALAGGVSLNLAPAGSVLFAKMKALAPMGDPRRSTPPRTASRAAKVPASSCSSGSATPCATVTRSAPSFAAPRSTTTAAPAA